MNVSACLVTRGDVDMNPILDSLPRHWERIIWDNSGPPHNKTERFWSAIVVGDRDLAVYGRYEAIQYAAHDLIYVQDDDCIVSDPRAIVDEWIHVPWAPGYEERGAPSREVLVANMPAQFRPHYEGGDSLVGFGACFRRDAPERTFQRWGAATFNRDGALAGDSTFIEHGRHSPFFYRACDIVFTGLTPTVLVDVEKFDRDFATADDRMYRQPEHVAERQRMRDLVAKVRDAT